MKKHTHKFETITHRGVSSKAIENGIQAVEIRKCEKCKYEALYLMNKKGEWFPLFEEDLTEGEILLA